MDKRTRELKASTRDIYYYKIFCRKNYNLKKIIMTTDMMINRFNDT